MQFSLYYRIQNRDIFFERFSKKVRSSNKSGDKIIAEILIDKYKELLELIVEMIITENVEDLFSVLSKPNAKIARNFFDYLTNSHIKYAKREMILKRLNEVFNKENYMKDFKSYLEEKVKPISLTKMKFGKFKLNEADDDAGADADADAGGDDAGADAGGDDAGGDPFGDVSDDAGGDPFGGDAGGDEGGASGSEGGDEGAEDEEGGEEGEGEGEEEDELDLEGHEDDPDFTEGVENSDDATLTDTPSGKCIYDVDGVMKSIKAVTESLPDFQLAEIDKVKKAITLIFNGKILKPEDVEFDNNKNAAFLIKKIGSNVDEKTWNYMKLKIKQPLIKQRDKQKEELATLKNDTSVIRDTISNLEN